MKPLKKASASGGAAASPLWHFDVPLVLPSLLVANANKALIVGHFDLDASEVATVRARELPRTEPELDGPFISIQDMLRRNELRLNGPYVDIKFKTIAASMLFKITHGGAA